MNIKEYISSGILEAYWAGELNQKEMLEVDRIAALYPEVQEELDKLRESISTYASHTEQTPNDEVLEKTLNAIDEDDRSRFLRALNEDDEPEVVIKRVNVVPVWSIAASILLIVSAGFNYLFFTEFKKAKYEVGELKADIELLQQDQQVLADLANDQKLELEYASLRIAHFLNKNNIHVRMDGLSISPESYANVFWNTKSNAVYISVDNLPEPPHGHQYQLWAIKPGQAPIDAGTFDHNKKVQELKVIKGNVDAFAVTLEKEGGSPVATVDKTFVKGFIRKS